MLIIFFFGCKPLLLILNTEGEEEITTKQEDSALFNRCSTLLFDMRHELSFSLTQFDKEISELLMTLQLVHPPNVSRIRSIDDLITFRGYVLVQSALVLSTTSIDHFIDIHQKFVDKVSLLSMFNSSIVYV